MVIIPLYDTLGPDACAFILNQGKWTSTDLASNHTSWTRKFLNVFPPNLARIKMTVCDASKVEILLKNVDKCKDLKYIIKIGDSVTEEEQEKAKEFGVEILTFSDVEVRACGASFLSSLQASTEYTILSVCIISL